ncbi:MAG: TIR domain-containing protein [Alphaproteobacteria bacterium]|nr:TIR domain-containing protein [Alphaproteobacteria bacterium]
MADIFISYSRADAEFVDRLVDLLKGHGLTVWWDRNIVGGTEFHRVIETEINAAGKVIVLWSKNSVDSVWVYDEASVARDQSKLVPLAIDDCVIPMGFRSIHTLRSANLDDIANDLLTACGRAPAPDATAKAGPQAKPTSQPPPNDTTDNQGNEADPASTGFSSVFDNVFGGIMGKPPTKHKRGSDLRFDMTITLEEAYSGKHAQVRIPTSPPCEKCNGSGNEKGTGSQACQNCHGTGRASKDKNLSVNIPAGVEDGTRIRLAGEGEPGAGGGPTGDLYIFLSIEPHPIFQRDGSDIFCRVPVSMTTAALGGKIDVPNLEGTISQVAIPEATQWGKQYRLRGKGMPKLRSVETGHLYVQIEIETPQELRNDAKAFIQDLQRQRPSIASQNVEVEERGLDLACEIEIPIVDAALGGEVTFKPGSYPTLLLRFPQGTQNGQTFRLRGRGKQGGDLYVTTKTQAMTDLTDNDRDLLHRIEALERLGKGPVYSERQSFYNRVKGLFEGKASQRGRQ